MSLINAFQSFGNINALQSLGNQSLGQEALNANLSAKRALESLKAGQVDAAKNFAKVTDSFSMPYGNTSELSTISTERGGRAGSVPFGKMLTQLVDAVDQKQKVAMGEAQDLMLGKSDNVHQAMIAMQESSTAFNLLLEVRNKLIESYKELSRMV
jgi:flagellar hook-basal body complex protein FliE